MRQVLRLRVPHIAPQQLAAWFGAGACSGERVSRGSSYTHGACAAAVLRLRVPQIAPQQLAAWFSAGGWVEARERWFGGAV